MADDRAPDTGVLLVNLGTPDAPTPGAVRRYLRQFLSDPRVVQLPRLVWLPILYLFVLPFRPAKTARKYAKVWTNDGSPLRVYHERQAQLLRGYLGTKMKRLVSVVAAMRYGRPSVAQGLAELRDKGVRRLLVIPMYPQYAASTTESVRDALHAALRKWKPQPQVDFVTDFHDHPAFAKAVAKNVGEYWLKHGRPDRLVMSFHGLPQRAIDAGTPIRRNASPPRAWWPPSWAGTTRARWWPSSRASAPPGGSGPRPTRRWRAWAAKAWAAWT